MLSDVPLCISPLYACISNRRARHGGSHPPGQWIDARRPRRMQRHRELRRIKERVAWIIYYMQKTQVGTPFGTFDCVRGRPRNSRSRLVRRVSAIGRRDTALLRTPRRLCAGHRGAHRLVQRAAAKQSELPVG